MTDRECCKCGCTDLSACIDDGEPCCWVDDALCSVCHDRLADTLRLAHFMPDLAERAAALLEEAEQL